MRLRGAKPQSSAGHDEILGHGGHYKDEMRKEKGAGGLFLSWALTVLRRLGEDRPAQDHLTFGIGPTDLEQRLRRDRWTGRVLIPKLRFRDKFSWS